MLAKSVTEHQSIHSPQQMAEAAVSRQISPGEVVPVLETEGLVVLRSCFWHMFAEWWVIHSRIAAGFMPRSYYTTLHPARRAVFLAELHGVFSYEFRSPLCFQSHQCQRHQCQRQQQRV